MEKRIEGQVLFFLILISTHLWILFCKTRFVAVIAKP